MYRRAIHFMDTFAISTKKYIEHDMIRSYTVLPEFPELRTNILRLFLKYGSKLTIKLHVQETIAMAIYLVQLGLDTHEFVTNQEDERRRQMQVLAGDYFSSRFYQLLSQSGKIDAIRSLSQSICEVNQLKTDLYLRAKKLILSTDEYVQIMVEIKTRLFLSLTNWMEDIYRLTCPSLFRLVAECEIIAYELTRTRPDNIKDGWLYWYVLQNGTRDEIDGITQNIVDDHVLQSIFSKYNIIEKLFQMLTMKITELRKLICSSELDKFSSQLELLLEPIFIQQKTVSVLKEI